MGKKTNKAQSYSETRGMRNECQKDLFFFSLWWILRFQFEIWKVMVFFVPWIFGLSHGSPDHPKECKCQDKQLRWYVMFLSYPILSHMKLLEAGYLIIFLGPVLELPMGFALGSAWRKCKHSRWAGWMTPHCSVIPQTHMFLLRNDRPFQPTVLVAVAVRDTSG